MGLPIGGIDRRRFLGMVAAVGAGGVMVAASSKASAFGFGAETETVLPSGAGWRLDPAKSDEFDGDVLDSTRWFKSHRHDPVSQVEFVDENVQVADGLLRIRLSDRPSGRGPHLSGVVRSTFAIGRDSYTEVRAKMIGTDANAASAIHLWRRNADVRQGAWPGGALNEEFHVYGIERRAGRIVFSIDGKQYRSYRENPEAVGEPRSLIMYIRGINEKKPINPEALPQDMLIDYVRVYKAV